MPSPGQPEPALYQPVSNISALRCTLSERIYELDRLMAFAMLPVNVRQREVVKKRLKSTSRRKRKL
jgi:hypothetical protein